MKKTTTILVASLALSFTPFASAEEGHEHGDHEGHEHAEHDHSGLTPPNGGRILTEVEPHAEFFLTEDRKVRITFLKDDGTVVAPGDQAITVITGTRSNPTRLTFEKDGKSFLSKDSVPEGDNLPVIAQIKMQANAKTTLIRFNLNLADCPTCDYLEYACSCDHGEHGHDHGDHEGHDH
ncbi:hypothetical protein [Roseibacillus ishigakijimensis]|uniref:DUF5666 domain-containing protein n=1 Tax=Roseibacillus ishigakijimensis TaxID=454146 RepID=A0A934RM59_9BACT|nr:hypothetical protein [Roseibacillus ishigakijimensis]MBK1834322.1 hypothetical protein [Roseibacillus ishigakijimensis]